MRRFAPTDTPASPAARWSDSELVVHSESAGSVSLFELPSDLRQCRIAFKFRIQAADLKPFVYAEMWCRIPNKGQFFSRGLDQKICGTVNWTEVEIPFFLEQEQRADLQIGRAHV